jgi:hypothetical protein
LQDLVGKVLADLTKVLNDAKGEYATEVKAVDSATATREHESQGRNSYAIGTDAVHGSYRRPNAGDVPTCPGECRQEHVLSMPSTHPLCLGGTYGA